MRLLRSRKYYDDLTANGLCVGGCSAASEQSRALSPGYSAVNLRRVYLATFSERLIGGMQLAWPP
jgi:hypothetical protein